MSSRDNLFFKFMMTAVLAKRRCDRFKTLQVTYVLKKVILSSSAYITIV